MPSLFYLLSRSDEIARPASLRCLWHQSHRVPRLICDGQHSTGIRVHLITSITVSGWPQERNRRRAPSQECTVHLWRTSEAAESPWAARQLKIDGPVHIEIVRKSASQAKLNANGQPHVLCIDQSKYRTLSVQSRRFKIGGNDKCHDVQTTIHFIVLPELR